MFYCRKEAAMPQTPQDWKNFSALPAEGKAILTFVGVASLLIVLVAAAIIRWLSAFVS